jgi:hypothetical protein
MIYKGVNHTVKSLTFETQFQFYKLALVAS